MTIWAFTHANNKQLVQTTILANYEFPSQEREADGPITNQAAIDLWHQKDVSVRNYILATLEQSQKQNLYGIPTAREMWLNISTQYTTRADEIEGQLLQDMWSYKYDPGKEKKNFDFNWTIWLFKVCLHIRCLYRSFGLYRMDFDQTIDAPYLTLATSHFKQLI